MPEPIRVASWLPDPPALPFGFLGEAPGDHEVSAAAAAAVRGERCPGPLIGPSGWKHERVLAAAAEAVGMPLNRRCAYHGNVFGYQMPDVLVGGVVKHNQLSPWLVPRDEHVAQLAAWRAANRPCAGQWAAEIERVVSTKLQGRWLTNTHWPELGRMFDELAAAVASGMTHLVAYGATAFWALTGRDDWAEARHHLGPCLVPGLTIMPTWHPAYALRNEVSTHALADDVQKLVQAALGTGAATLVEPIVWVPETADELDQLIQIHISPYPRCAWDAEWGFPKLPSGSSRPPVPGSRDTLVITSVQLCADGRNAVVVPFFWAGASDGCWWRTASEHARVIEALRTLNEGHQANVWHNGINTDTHVLLEELDIIPRIDDDTLLQSHALSPGAPKSLTEVVGRHCNGRSWKYHRRATKRDE